MKIFDSALFSTFKSTRFNAITPKLASQIPRILTHLLSHLKGTSSLSTLFIFRRSMLPLKNLSNF